MFNFGQQPSIIRMQIARFTAPTVSLAIGAIGWAQVHVSRDSCCCRPVSGSKLFKTYPVVSCVERERGRRKSTLAAYWLGLQRWRTVGSAANRGPDSLGTTAAGTYSGGSSDVPASRENASWGGPRLSPRPPTQVNSFQPAPPFPTATSPGVLVRSGLFCPVLFARGIHRSHAFEQYQDILWRAS